MFPVERSVDSRSSRPTLHYSPTYLVNHLDLGYRATGCTTSACQARALRSVHGVVNTYATTRHKAGLALPRHVRPIFSRVFLCLEQVAVVEKLIRTTSIVQVPATRYELEICNHLDKFFYLVLKEQVSTHVMDKRLGQVCPSLTTLMCILLSEDVFAKLGTEHRVFIRFKCHKYYNPPA